MEGLGNTFVVVLGPLSPTEQEVINLCRGYGEKPADGLLVATPINSSAVRMQYWNTDGSPAEMCGNGLRCLAKFARAEGLVNKASFVVQTDAGQLEVRCDDSDEELVEVQVGKVAVSDKPINIHGEKFFTANVGNPHAVTFVDDLESAPVTILGPKVEVDNHFPNKTNVEFVQSVDQNNIILRTWERGVGETLACGTGMTAASAVFVEYGHGEYPLTVEVRGGRAKLWVDENGFTRMLGPATFS